MKYLKGLLFLLLLGCNRNTKLSHLPPLYEAKIYSDGGEIIFPIHNLSNSNTINVFVTNGIDTNRFTSVRLLKAKSGVDSIIFSFDHYDSHIRATINFDESLEGIWEKRLEGGVYEPQRFTAKPVREFFRYGKNETSNQFFDGEWKTTFIEDDASTYPAIASFAYTNDQFFGNFITETGDYRFLEGVVMDSSFILSVFDGAHAYRFDARLNDEGHLVGDFWSRQSYHERFIAKKEQIVLKDAQEIEILNSDQPKIEFSFPNDDGNMISSADLAFKDKPILLYVFGSWCPNCADEANMLTKLYKESYSDTDLEIVGLAFEYTGDFESDSKMVKQYISRFEIPWTVLVAGISDKESAASVLPFVDRLTSFPTVFFADRNHKILSTHVGFKGPGTGTYYQKEIQIFKNEIDKILSTN